MVEVLIVDDEADAREPLGKFLVKAGHAVRHAPGGQEALAEVVLKLPDVVLLDLLMPKISGTDFLAVVRSYRRFRSLPVVVLTGLFDTPELERAAKLGVHSVLLKSKVTFEDIRRAVEDAARGGAAA